MRAIEVTLFLIFMLAAIPVMLVLYPTLSPISTANASIAVDKMNVTALSAEKPVNGNIFDEAKYYGQMALMTIDAGISFMLSILWSFPALITIFGINPTLAVFLGVGVFSIFMIALWQWRKGDTFQGKR